jgi:glycosyltransferase involved in cell wall biosynthesis
MPAPEPIRLALVITELDVGGAEKCLVELATRLDRTRYAPVVYPLKPLPDRSQLVDRLIEAEIRVDVLALQHSWEYFRGVRQLAALLRHERTQIVQTFLFHANVMGARAALAAGVPHLVTGMRVADPRRWRIAVERWSTAGADQFVCVSQDVAAHYRNHGFAAEKLLVIPNGIDVGRWRDVQPADLRQFGLPPGRRAFVFVGRLDEQKGLDRFFCELPRALEQLPEHDLLLVGEGNQRQLRALAQRLAIADRVHFAGWQPNVPEILAATDLLVLPSRWEGMPNVVLEAMAAGKPVVAMRAHGVQELLGDAAEEQMAPLGDFPHLRCRLIEILHNRERAAKLGEHNRLFAHHFSLDSMTSAYDRLYMKVVRKEVQDSGLRQSTGPSRGESRSS